MRRFSILTLMGCVLACGVAIAALRNADEYWAGGTILFTALLIDLASLGVAYSFGRRRALRLGFAVFCGGYFALAFLGLSEPDLAGLPTSLLLGYVHQRVAPAQTFAFTTMAAPPAQVGSTTILLSNLSSGPLPNTITTTTTSKIAPSNVIVAGNRWKTILPGAANYEAFGAVGHCVFAILAGMVGALISVRMWSRRERAEAV